MKDFLRTLKTREFGLRELEAAASDLLRQAGGGIGDGRICDTPDGRTLRYYQSTGIMERPVRYEGRSAVYGYKSLLQAVCTKLLQSRGFSLAQVQNALTGAPVGQLEEAVLESLGTSAAPTPPQNETQPIRLVSAEVAPGVVLTVDPRVVSNPDDVLRRIQFTLNQGDQP